MRTLLGGIWDAGIQRMPIVQILKNETYTVPNVAGGTILIGHWVRGWGLYQYGRQITPSFLVGSNVNGVTITYENDTLTITTNSTYDCVIVHMV